MNTKHDPKARRIVTEMLGEHPVTFDLNYQTIEEAIKALQDIRQQYPDALNLRFRHGCCWQYDPNEYYYLVYDRAENDSEYKVRMLEMDAQEAKDRAEYIRLKEKYEQP